MNASGQSVATEQPWWGEFTVPPGETLSTEINGMRVTISRRPGEWQVATVRATDQAGDAAEPRRYVFEHTDERVYLLPRLADRPVIMRPLNPLTVAPGAQTEIYVSSPVLVQVAVGPDRTALEEVFSVQPSDTWFGESTIAGELCYASRTRARLRPDELPPTNDRAMTAVRISNRGSDPLHIERLALRAPNLDLFATAAGALWTEDIALDRAGGDRLTRLTRIDGPPRHAHGAELLGTAREPMARNFVVRAFGEMFS